MSLLITEEQSRCVLIWSVGNPLRLHKLNGFPSLCFKPNVFSVLKGVCRNLKSIVVQVGIADYFKEPNSSEARKMFEEMVNKLQVKELPCFWSTVPAGVPILLSCICLGCKFQKWHIYTVHGRPRAEYGRC